MSDAQDVFALAPGLRVVVTAGASGIGRAIADLLIARGARVHICDVSDEFLADFRAAHPRGGRDQGRRFVGEPTSRGCSRKRAPRSAASTR